MNRNKLLIYFFILLIGLSITFFTIHFSFNPKTVGVLIFLLVFIPTLIKPDIGLVIIIFSTFFSPEIILGITSQREITLRIEDIFLLLVIFAWFIRIAFTKDIRKTFKTKLTLPFFLYIATCIFSSLFASIFSEIDIKYSFLCILKYLQYFLLFLMVKDNIRSLRQIKFFIGLFILVAGILAIHTNIFIQEKLTLGETFFRVGPLIGTRGKSESATLAGFLIFMMGLVGGLSISMRSIPLRIFLIFLFLIMFRAFLYTLSRGAYLAFLPMLFTLAFCSRKIISIYGIIIFLLIFTLLMPKIVRERIVNTLVAKESVEGTYLEWEESARARIDTWQEVLFNYFPARPLFGYGVGSRFIDSQIFLTLYETGLLGLFLLIWLWLRIFKLAKEVFNLESIKSNNFTKGLSLGFLSGYIGLIVQAFSTNTFIIIRIMEPFWFITALVITLPQLLKNK